MMRKLISRMSNSKTDRQGEMTISGIINLSFFNLVSCHLISIGEVQLPQAPASSREVPQVFRKLPGPKETQGLKKPKEIGEFPIKEVWRFRFLVVKSIYFCVKK